VGRFFATYILPKSNLKKTNSKSKVTKADLPQWQLLSVAATVVEPLDFSDPVKKNPALGDL
jgi:hypothetical protein